MAVFFNISDIRTRNRYQIPVPENWYQNLVHQFLLPVARFLVPETNMADDATYKLTNNYYGSELTQPTIHSKFFR